VPKSVILYTDGACKGNPGPSGIGGALYRAGEAEPFRTYAEGIGKTTNNVAEYRALLRGLREALLDGADEIEIRTDSELMARQLTGRYRVAAPQIQPLHAEALALVARFDKAAIRHVPREQNALADRLANQGVSGGR
jgi:ribonuclease HI